jgi:hypothetical protein
VSEGVEPTDRYAALGVPWPDPATVCRGPCEGTGVVPVFLAEGRAYLESPSAVVLEDEQDPQLVAAWEAAEAERPTDNGWHFVVCPDCGGRGRADAGT